MYTWNDISPLLSLCVPVVYTHLILFYSTDKGAKEAQDMREHFSKLAAKIAVYYSDDKITDEEEQHMRDVMMNLFQSFVRCANTTGSAKIGSNKEREVDKFVIELNHFHTEAMAIIQKLMSQKNSQRLTVIVNFFSNKDLLMQLFTSYDYKEKREELKDIIMMLVAHG